MCNQCVRKISKLSNLTSGLWSQIQNIGKCPAMKALEDLTPTGSEFWEDPKRCYEFVRDQIANRWRLLVQTTQQRNTLREQLEREHSQGT